MTETFWLSVNYGPWEQVSKTQYVAAERAAGFRNSLGHDAEPATSAFSGRGIDGRQGFLMQPAGLEQR